MKRIDLISRLVPTLCVLLVTASFARADLDAQVKTPYQLQVVLRIGANRVFTPLFQDQLQRELGNRLKIAFGDLARVDVTHTHPLLRDIDARGLDAAIEGWDAMSEHETFFVLLDYDAGMYQIQTRGHDGITNRAYGATTRLKTADRTALADTIAQQIEKSFSPVGTVTAVDKNGKDVTLTLKGGDLGVSMSNWVKPGHVFSVSRIVQQVGRTRAVRQEWALLEVIDPPNAGVCRCRYWHRYQEDALRPAPGTLGWRALHLTTKVGPVKLQLLDDDTKLQPLDGVRVHILKPGSKDKATELITNRDGVALTRDNFAHLAIVQVLSEGKVRAQFPVATIPGRTVVARVKIQVDTESLVPLQTRRDAWLRRIYDNVLTSGERSAELSGLLNQSLQAALDSARKRLTPLEEEIKYLDSEQDELHRLAKERKTSFDLREGVQQLAELRAQAQSLDAFVKRLEGVLKDPDAEKSIGLTKLVERARLLEAEADYPGAIRLYDQVVQASPEQTKIKAHLKSLQAAWEPKSKEHKAARRFIYDIWPTLDAGGIQDAMKQAEKAVADCKAVGDTLTLHKLLRVNVTHTVNLKKQLETLRRRDSEDNRNRAKALVQVSEALLNLHNDAAAFVGARKD